MTHGQTEAAHVTYAAPTTLAEAVRALHASGEAAPFAGGTDLLVHYHTRSRRPRAFIDLKRIPELVGIAHTADGLRIGAATPAADLTADPHLRRYFPGVVDGVALIGSQQIQGRASIGGNLCNGSPAADAVPALIAAGATLVVTGPDGTRSVPVEQFVVAPGRTVLRRGEVLEAILLPTPTEGTTSAYLRVTPRTEMDIAVASAGVQLTLDPSGRCVAARVAIGAVAPTARLVPEAGEPLLGTALDEAAIARAADAVRAAAQPIDDKRGTAAYRRHVVGVLTARAMTRAVARAQGRG